MHTLLQAFFHMVVDYKASIGFDAKCLIEPKPREPTKHQYDYDAQTVMGFLSQCVVLSHRMFALRCAAIRMTTQKRAPTYPIF